MFKGIGMILPGLVAVAIGVGILAVIYSFVTFIWDYDKIGCEPDAREKARDYITEKLKSEYGNWFMYDEHILPLQTIHEGNGIWTVTGVINWPDHGYPKDGPGVWVRKKFGQFERCSRSEEGSYKMRLKRGSYKIRLRHISNICYPVESCKVQIEGGP